MPKELLPLKETLDEFRVLCRGFEVSVRPKLGQVWSDSSLVSVLPLPCSLIWFRRMQVKIATLDDTQDAPQCVWYGLGLQCQNKKFGFRILEDGSVRLGELN